MFRKKDKVDKGAPSGLVISLAIHAAAFFAAGTFLVFQAIQPPVAEFVPPPPIVRPKMQLKKPKVKVQKNSQPKPSSRIVAKVKTREMPEIQLPDLMGSGEGLMGGTGLGDGFLDLPEIAEMNIIGTTVTTGSDLEATFYCFNRLANGRTSRLSHFQMTSVVRDFVEGGWNTSMLQKYYHSPRKLYAQTIAIPACTSMVGPVSFGEEPDINMAECWIAHYRGVISNKDGVTFRFWGHADDILTVALNKKVVLAANLPWNGIEAWTIGQKWGDRAPGSRGITDTSGIYMCGIGVLAGCNWLTLEPGIPYDFDAVVGEAPGGEFFAMLLVEVKGVEYKNNDWGGKEFDLFATGPLSRELQDSILMGMYEGDANVTNISTYFNDL